MALLPPHAVHLVVRWVHVLGMATLFGGAVLTWTALRSDPPSPAAGEGTREPIRIAAAYEWLFWAGAGLLVLTGVGNLGAMAPAIPGPGTSWGATLSVKLAAVLVLLLGSLVRTLGVAGLLVGSRAPATTAASDRLRLGYAATAVFLLLVVLLAEVLAHG